MTSESRPIVVMGVSGVGKTTVGRELARRMGVAFIDADDLHGPENIAKMAAGAPLDDDDR
ncbi:gluconokinase [Microbacterium sp.]